MTITLELTDTQRERLYARALQNGYTNIEDYLLSLAEWEPLSEEEWKASLKRLHDLTKDVPPLPDEAFRRETIYRD